MVDDDTTIELQCSHTIFLWYILLDNRIRTSSVILKTHRYGSENLHIETEIPSLGTFPLQIRVRKTCDAGIVFIITRKQTTIRSYQFRTDGIDYISLNTICCTEVKLVKPLHVVFDKLLFCYLPRETERISRIKLLTLILSETVGSI